MIYDFLQRFISRYAEIQPLLVFFATAQVNVSANTFGQVSLQCEEDLKTVSVT